MSALDRPVAVRIEAADLVRSVMEVRPSAVLAALDLEQRIDLAERLRRAVYDVRDADVPGSKFNAVVDALCEEVSS